VIVYPRGAEPLRELIARHDRDVRSLELDGFRDWLDTHLRRWRRDPVFVQQCAIRDLRRAHPAIGRLEQQRRRLLAADRASAHGARLSRLTRDLADTEKALAGIAKALTAASSGRIPGLQRKLRAFEARQRVLRAEYEILLSLSPERQALLAVEAELNQAFADSGLALAQARLAELQRQQGRYGGRAGRDFERDALAFTRRALLPELLRRCARAPRARVLTGVTLGAADTELDQLVVWVRPRRPVEVLALVEAKRNINDLARGFEQRQRNLAWLSGDRSGYDPRRFRTQWFLSGHFDREAVHEEAGERFLFAPSSFRRFRRDPVSGHFLGRFYLVTRPGPLWGLSGSALARLRYRVATDPRWSDDGDSLRRLRGWCRNTAADRETPDLLRLYLTSRYARQIVLIDGPDNGEA